MEILERCTTWAGYVHYRPSRYTGMVESWEVLDAAVRKRHHSHPNESMEDVFSRAHRNKRRAAIQ